MTAVVQAPGFTDDESPVGIEVTEASINVLLTRVMNEVSSVAKSQSFIEDYGKDAGKVKYRFRGIDAVVNALAPAFRKHNVVPVPVLEDMQTRDVQSANNRRMSEVRVRVRYEFWGPLGDHLDAVVPGEAFDTSDKATAKAMSVAYRIALLQVFALPTDDPDPDETYIERGNGAPRSTADEAADREQTRLTRQEILDDLNQVLLKVQEARGESDYAAAERIARHCLNTHEVDIVTKRGPDGEIEEYSLAKLNDGQLAVTRRAVRIALAKATGADSEV